MPDPTVSDLAFYGLDAATLRPLSTNIGSVTNLDSIRNTINTRETDALNGSLITANSTANSMVVYGGLLSRNATINAIANDMTAQNKKTAAGGADTFSRQSEINEWQAQNKLDTLFFMQILFLYFAVLVICLYFRQVGILPSSVFYILAFIGFIIVFGVLWNRASYTRTSRDKRYWNRRYIGLGDSDLAAKLQCSLSSS